MPTHLLERMVDLARVEPATPAMLIECFPANRRAYVQNTIQKQIDNM